MVVFRRTVKRWQERYGLGLWKLVLAALALLDFLICADSTTNENQSIPTSSSPATSSSWLFSDSATLEKVQCLEEEHVNENSVILMYASFIRRVFGGAFILEAIRQAHKARQLALENEALDQFEQKLADLYQVTRCTVFRQQPTPEDYEERQWARSTVRSWTPVASMLIGWMLLVPWPSRNELAATVGGACATDTSLAALWITQALEMASNTLEYVKKHVLSTIWKQFLPLGLVVHPLILIKRIRLVLRWLRYLRFAGPLVRLLLKLSDQYREISKTWRQSLVTQMERTKRLARRSLLVEDLQRIESLAQFPRALTQVPSQLFSLVQSSSLKTRFASRRAHSQRLESRIRKLRHDVSTKSTPTGEIYQRVVDLTQELKQTVRTAVWNANLIAPQTRFSVTWRLVVTAALLAELCRLAWSWHLSATFGLRYSDLVLQFVACQPRKGHSNAVAAMWDFLRRRPSIDDVPCPPASAWGSAALGMARIGEGLMAAVCFADIIVWFLTGDLTPQGVIVPKPFFARCILPGTLVQVLDHPTVPDVLPRTLAQALSACRQLGYGRVIRWALMLYPACELLIVHPLYMYFFRPLDDQEFLRYTESWIPAGTSMAAMVAQPSSPRLLSVSSPISTTKRHKENRLSRSGTAFSFQLDENPSADLDTSTRLTATGTTSTTTNTTTSSYLHSLHSAEAMPSSDSFAQLGYGLYY